MSPLKGENFHWLMAKGEVRETWLMKRILCAMAGLKMDVPCEEECRWVASRTWKQPLVVSQKENSITNPVCKKLDSANNLNELGSRFFFRASKIRRVLSGRHNAVSLVRSLAEYRTARLDSDLQNCKIINGYCFKSLHFWSLIMNAAIENKYS